MRISVARIAILIAVACADDGTAALHAQAMAHVHAGRYHEALPLLRAAVGLGARGTRPEA